MKTLIITILSMWAICSCSTSEIDNMEYRYFDGHLYIVHTTNKGITTIHAPNCPCMKHNRQVFLEHYKKFI